MTDPDPPAPKLIEGGGVKLEDQVCSLELAKKLNELGVKKESIFQWSVDGKLMEAMWPNKNQYVQCSALTVSELGELLGRHVNAVDWHTHGWRCWWDIGKEDYFNTEADARAKMLIHLIERGIVKPNEKEVA